MNVCAKFRCALLRIKKALGIFRALITTTRVPFWDLPSTSKKVIVINLERLAAVVSLHCGC